jgi:TonB family protein
MLQKNKSKRIALAKYGLSAPLFVLMLILSSATVNNSKALKNITTKTEDVLLVPASSSIGILTEGKDIEVTLPLMLADTIKYTQQPSFPGGRAALVKYLGRNVVYPAMDRENNIQGKVNLQFNVETDGSVTDVIAVSGPSQTLKDAAITAMKNSPKWIPGYKDGKLVKMPYTHEVNFTLGNEISNGVRLPVVDNSGGNQVYTVLETQPKFPGGTQNFLKFLAANIKYPADDRKNNVQGRVVIQFVIEKDGSLTNVKAIRGPSEAMSEEAVRVLSTSPKWNPGIQDGRPVRAQYTVPVNFTLGGNGNVSDAVVNSLVTVRGALGDPKNQPMILIDGVEVSDISKVDPNIIEYVTILKDATATSRYGEKAKNGVIIIGTKGKSPKEEAPTPPTKKQ